MSSDVSIASNLAAAIGGQSFSKSFAVDFTFDQYIENDKVDSILLRVGIESEQRQRQGRGSWVKDCQLSLVMIAPQQINTTTAVNAESEITNLLTFWDEVVDFVQDYKPLGHMASTIDSFGRTRFDREKLHEDRMFRAGVAVTYKIISN